MIKVTLVNGEELTICPNCGIVNSIVSEDFSLFKNIEITDDCDDEDDDIEDEDTDIDEIDEPKIIATFAAKGYVFNAKLDEPVLLEDEDYFIGTVAGNLYVFNNPQIGIGEQGVCLLSRRIVSISDDGMITKLKPGHVYISNIELMEPVNLD